MGTTVAASRLADSESRFFPMRLFGGMGMSDGRSCEGAGTTPNLSPAVGRSGHVVLFGQKLVPLFLTRYVLSNCICSKLRRSCLPFSLRYAGNQDKEQWDKNEIDERGGEHAAANGGANGIHCTGTGAVGHGQRQNAEEKSQ